ncbi:TRAF-interacting protein with FHA domain-containing protein A-like [Ambystoma mexicanum]|uniref:TRAF-interacting protein with FHA domain-containing protein A-like n=1 Tax=Ambystoma mexicanum TaxID=8296 RepID=UPI0037E73597
MANFNDAETEERLTCLRMKVYHPQNIQKQVFQSIPFLTKEKHKTDVAVMFGRDISACRYVLWDRRASRVQFVLQVFRPFNISELSFEVKNLSRRTNLFVDNVELSYLNKMELPSKCMFRFADFQFLVERDAGESLEDFETYFELMPTSLLQELYVEPSMHPIPEHGIERLSLNARLPFSRAETAEEVEESRP